jgi:NADH-quinone oxidoreductase subunit L
MSAADLFWLAPALPLTAFVALVAGLVGAGRKAAGLVVAAIAGSAVISVLALIAAGNSARAEVSVLWLAVGGRQLALALWLDPLGAVVAVLVSVVALVIFVYAVRYMAGDPRCGRFFALLSLFAGAMLTLVLAADLLMLFIAWELVGLCSYLLIGFWFERPGVPAAATKALLTTRLTDLAMLAGVLVLVGAAGSSRIAIVVAAATSGQIAPGLLLASTLLLFIGAAGKSAQVPFQGWLPDAMVGPTPVSALLHSATMVAAGVFLVARLHIVFSTAHPGLLITAWVGAITALLGGRRHWSSATSSAPWPTRR